MYLKYHTVSQYSEWLKARDASPWSLYWSHLNKGCTHPVTMLQNRKNFMCSIGILGVTISTSILRSDKWYPLKNSRDSWFGAQWRGRLCFIQVRSVYEPGEDKVRYAKSLAKQAQGFFYTIHFQSRIYNLLLVTINL